MAPEEIKEIKDYAEVLTRAIEDDWKTRQKSAHSTDYWMRCAVDMSRAVPKLVAEIERLRAGRDTAVKAACGIPVSE